MAKLDIKVGATSVSVGLFIQDSSSTTGAGLTGLAFNTASLTCYAVVPGSSAAAITLATLAAANSAWSSGGFKEIDSTNMPGWYRFDIPNTNISTGRSVGIHFKGATNMAPLPLEISLTGWDNQSTTDGGLSKLTSLTFTGANKVDASMRDCGGTTVTARDIGASVLLSAGSGAGQLDFTSGVVKANATQWLGGTIPAVNVTGVPLVDAKYLLGTIFSTPATAGILDVNVKNMNNVAGTAITTVKAVQGLTTADTIATYTGNTPQTGDAYARLGAPTGATIAADIQEIEGETDTLIAGVTVTTNNDKTGYTLTAGERTSIADAMLDETNGVETSYTVRGALRLMLAALAGKLSGAATTTVTIRNVGDAKDRITATVDANGNRSAVTTDAT